MARFDYDLGVIGGGAAGLSVAAGAARFGAKVLLVDAGPSLGGDCLHHGCVPSKTLIHTANLRQAMRGAARFGLEPGEVPPADMAKVAARVREVIETVGRHDSVTRFEKLGVSVVFDRPAFSDDHELRLESGPVTAAKWVVATGSSPAVPGGVGLTEAGTLTNRDIFSLQTLPDRLAVLGAGPVAVEMAQAFARLGSKVTLVHRGRGILKRADGELAELLKTRLLAEGVAFAENVRLERVTCEAGVTRIAGTQDDKPFALDAEAVLAALGRVPNVDGLGLDNAGVDHGPGGIKVDARLRTSRPHIYACGDVTGQYQFTHAAGYEASVVVTNAVLRLPRKADYRLFPWVAFTSPELGQIGMTEDEARQAGHEVTVTAEDFAASDRAQAEGETVGRIKLVTGPKSRVLGVSVLGARAGELICEWATALGAGLSPARLAGVVHPYPTFGELNKTLAGKLVAEKLFSPAVKNTLRLLFGLRGI